MEVSLALAGRRSDGTNPKLYKSESFEPNASFSRKIPLPNSVVCRCGRRATQPGKLEEETTVTLHLHVTRAHEGLSPVFATATEEVLKPQKAAGSVSTGVSVATLTMPSTSGRALTAYIRPRS